MEITSRKNYADMLNFQVRDKNIIIEACQSCSNLITSMFLEEEGVVGCQLLYLPIFYLAAFFFLVFDVQSGRAFHSNQHLASHRCAFINFQSPDPLL